MPDVPADKLRLHLLAERAMGLNDIPVGRRRGKRTADAKPGSASAPSQVASTRPPAPRSSTPAVLPQPAPALPAPSLPAPSLPAAPPARRAVTARDPVDATVAPAALFAPAPLGPITAPVLPPDQRAIHLRQLDENEVRGCTRCRLCETRTNTVFGEGDPAARLMFIGEGPGENEDLQGKPFIGKAGDLLGRQIIAMGLTREQVFIANVVKCRPPGNRTPLPDEVATCTPYLIRQIEIVRPDVIVTLGLPATRFILGNDKITMGKARMGWHEWRGIPVRPTYHPAYLLRSYTPANRKLVWEDLQEVMDRLGLKKT